MKTLIVIPCYNAQSTIEDVIKRVPREFKSNLLVIDDGSTDSVCRILKKNNIRFIKHRINRGYGAAQKTGIMFALKKAYDIVVILHADGQYPPEKIPILVLPIIGGKADIVSGSRMLTNSKREEMPILRIFGNRLLTFLENLILKTSITCYHCGFRAYSRRLLLSVNFLLNSDSFGFDSEILFQAVNKGFKIKEIPIDASYGAEVSYLNPITYGIDILKLIFRLFAHKFSLRKSKQFE